MYNLICKKFRLYEAYIIHKHGVNVKWVRGDEFQCISQMAEVSTKNLPLMDNILVEVKNF